MKRDIKTEYNLQIYENSKVHNLYHKIYIKYIEISIIK